MDGETIYWLSRGLCVSANKDSMESRFHFQINFGYREDTKRQAANFEIGANSQITQLASEKPSV